MYYIYMLLCSDNSIYTGITTDLDKRLSNHNKGLGAKYTRCRTPVRLIYYEEALDRSSASKREVAIKKLKRIKKISLVSSLENKCPLTDKNLLIPAKKK